MSAMPHEQNHALFTGLLSKSTRLGGFLLKIAGIDSVKQA